MICFADIDKCPSGYRLYKISNLISKLNNNFNEGYIPYEHLCIDESVTPFRGWLKFKPGKADKYWGNIFKLFARRLHMESNSLF